MEASVLDIYFLCGEKFTENDEIVNVTEKGLRTIQEVNKKRGDDKFTFILNKSTAKLHKICWKNYTR